MKVYLYINDTLFRYGFPSHPLTTSRYQYFLKYYRSHRDRLGCVEEVNRYPCKDEYLTLFHTEEYVRYVKQMSELGYGYLDYGDTPAYKGVYEVSLHTVCATRDAVLRTLKGGIAVNLAGGWHHSFRNRASGFCVFNDIAVAIESIRERVLNIMYIDIDAHHGDGVYYSYEADPSIYIFDIHETPRFLYPGTGYSYENGSGPAKGTKINVEMEPGSKGIDLLRQLDKLVGFIDKASPEYFILQAGTDGLAGDPLTHLEYDVESFIEMVLTIIKIAVDRGIGITLLGGGGYQPEKFGYVWVEIVKRICDFKR